MKNTLVTHRIVYAVSISAFVLFASHAAATNQTEDVIVTLPENTLTVHTNQTLVGTTPGQYSVKNLFDADPAKAWVFNAEEEYHGAEKLKKSAVLTLKLSRPRPLFAIILTPGYNKSVATQFQNSSPRNILVNLYRPNDAKPFESRLFLLSYHARQYALPALQKELKTVAFTDQTENLIIGKSDNPINSAERMLLINHSGVSIAKVELEISSIEQGAKFTDVALSKLRLLDSQADQNTPEYKLAQYIYQDFDHAVQKLADVPRCIVYTAKNRWPLLRNQACTGPMPKVHFASTDPDVDEDPNSSVIVTRLDPASHEYQTPFPITLRDEIASNSGKKRNLRISAADVVARELIIVKTTVGQLQALSGMALTQVFLANQQDGFDKAYLQTNNDPDSYFFFARSRLQFTANKDNYQLSIYGPVGNQEVKWTIK